MSNLKRIITGIAIGATIGYAINKIKQPEYTLKEKNNQTYLITKKPRNEYKIHKTPNTFYLGTLEHNLNGVKNTAYNYGLQLKENHIKELQQQQNELEQRINEQDKKIRRRRIFDKIDETKDKIKYWYNDLKRRQLE